MISVSEARNLIEQHTPTGEMQLIPVRDSLGYVMFSSIPAPIDSPPFHQSAMDGYAFRFEDLSRQTTFDLQGIIQAGDTTSYTLEPGKCFRIFTGAPIPEGADTVMMQEHCTTNGNSIRFNHPQPLAGEHIRPQGSQVQKGSAIGSSGQLLTPGIIGYLLTLGMSMVPVYRKPRIGVLVTGKELVQAGEVLGHGQIYESNGGMLAAALQEGRLAAHSVSYADDDLDLTKNAIEQLLHTCDVLLITGGISVGDYDFVQPALQANQVETIFYKVKQKPGKPLYFGRRGNTLIFALPGNPSAVLTCFYEYVVPCLRKLIGMPPQSEQFFRLPLLQDYRKKGELTHFLKARIEGDGVRILDGQESYKLHSFMDADCLVTLQSDMQQCKKGDWVDVFKLESAWR